MTKFKFYEINDDYINYLSEIDNKVAETKTNYRTFSRKYIGIIFEIDDFKYFVNLSSFKQKHKNMNDTIDFIKIKNYCVININNMIPVPDSELKEIIFSNIMDYKYKNLLEKEYKAIKPKFSTILANAKIVYNEKIHNPSSSLSNRCCDFEKLEKAHNIWIMKNINSTALI